MKDYNSDVKQDFKITIFCMELWKMVAYINDYKKSVMNFMKI